MNNIQELITDDIAENINITPQEFIIVIEAMGVTQLNVVAVAEDCLTFILVSRNRGNLWVISILPTFFFRLVHNAWDDSLHRETLHQCLLKCMVPSLADVTAQLCLGVTEETKLSALPIGG